MKKVFYVLAILVILVAFVGAYTTISANNPNDSKIITVFYNNVSFNFRDDVNEAEKIGFEIVETNLEDFKRDFYFHENDKIYIVHKLGTEETNSLNAVEALELTIKLTYWLERLPIWYRPKDYIPEEIDSYQNITNHSPFYNIVLIPPEFANSTYVKIENKNIFISGKTKKDFDLATMKFLLSMIGEYKKVKNTPNGYVFIDN